MDSVILDSQMVKDILTLDEGRKSKPYKDTEGFTTIGIGRNLDGVGLSPDEIDYLFENDVNRTVGFLKRMFSSFASFSARRQTALISWGFQGEGTCRQFIKMIAAVNRNDWENAAKELLDSKYATQVGARAFRLAKMLLEG